MHFKKVNSVTYFAMAFLGIYITLYQRILDVIGNDMMLNKTSMALLVTMHFMGFLISPLIAGEMSDKRGRRKIISGAYAVFLAGIIFILFSSNIYILSIGIFLVGAGFGVIEGGLTTLLSDLNVEDENKVINISQLFFTLGAVIGPFIVIGFLRFSNNWRLLYIVFLIPLAYFFLFYKKSEYPDKKLQEKIEGTIAAKLIKNKTFLLLCISMIMYVGIEEGIAFWITSYMKEMISDELLPTLALSLYWASMAIGRYFMSKYESKLNELIIMSSVFSAFFILLGVGFDNYIFSLISFAGIGFGFSGIWPMIMVITGRRYSQYTGTAFGIMMTCCALGGIIVPYIMGFIAEIYNMKAALSFTLLPILVIISNFLVIKKEKSKPV
ncbi:MAG: MFS transporter [Clostridia bacterium]|nr:MFS transporter [Clostridia bacterium]